MRVDGVELLFLRDLSTGVVELAEPSRLEAALAERSFRRIWMLFDLENEGWERQLVAEAAGHLDLESSTEAGGAHLYLFRW